jgi:oligopeptide/dipeptide ABC transporter ATP-binding protein
MSATTDATAQRVDRSPLLSVENLEVRFEARDAEIRAVNGVSFRIENGETVALVGESGSGKSTIGLAIMGLVRGAGRAHVGGEIALQFKGGRRHDLVRLSERDLRHMRGNEVAMIFQEPMSSLNPVYTVEWQICEAITIHQRVSRAAARRLALDLLDALGIASPAKCLASYPHQLSGGMRQRVMIAIALSCRPSLLIADEPTTALDVTIQAQILDLLRRIQSETGMAMLFITHNLGVVAEIASRVMVLYGGKVVEQGATADVFAAPRMPYTRSLIRSIPRLGNGDGRPLTVIPGQVPSPRALPSGCAFHPRCEHAEPGRCDRLIPPIEDCEPGHRVRCLRWREIGSEGTA